MPTPVDEAVSGRDCSRVPCQGGLSEQVTSLGDKKSLLCTPLQKRLEYPPYADDDYPLLDTDRSVQILSGT